MSVYVGNIEWGYGRMKMFHMVADSLEELNEMADKIGVQRKWIQHKDAGHIITHYDICKSKKQIAINNGAIEISDREIVKRFK